MADVPGKFFKATKVRTGVSPSSPGVIEGETLPPLNPPGGSLNSVGLSMPSAFNVANSPLTSNGTLAVTGAGTVGQYIRGDGSLADFPQASGGGSSVSYYLNGSVNQGTIGGVAYRELSKVPILGAGTDFTINADGYIASFITDAGDPNLLEIPGGNWNFETYFSASSSGGTPTFYVELYKVSGTTATLIASSSSAPELIAFGTNLTPYYSTLAVPTTTLALTDRLAVRYYVSHSGRTITLHTENNHLCQIITTFTTGLTALNGLTAQVQNFAVGTSGTDFNIASATATHTFNLPTASATNRGALSSADWSLFRQAYNDKINSASVTGTTTKTLTLVQQDGGEIQASWSDLNTDAVTSVFGRTGAVVAVSGDYNTSQVTESGNLYFTQARVSANTDVAANTAARHNAVTLGTANGLSLSTQQLSLGLASGSTTGALSSTDWNTFNNKQNALINPVTGTGTSGRIAYWDGTNSITSDGGLTWDDASNRLTIGLLSTNVPLVVSNGDVNSLVALLTGNNAARGLLIGTYNSGADDSGVTINAQHSSGQISLGTAGNQRVIISNDSVNFRHTTLAASSVYFDTTYQDAFTINSLGRLLVNKTDDNGARLQVTGDGRFSSSLTASSFIRTGGTSSQYLMADGSVSTLTNPVTGTGTTNYLPKFTGSATIGNSQIFDNGTNVGIGTPSPVTKFTVQTSNTRFEVDELNSTTSYIEILNTGRSATLNLATYAKGYTFNTRLGSAAYNPSMTLTDSGNLGLGVTPSAWASDFRAMQIGLGTSLYNNGNTNGTFLGSNFFFNGSNNIYIGTGTATAYAQSLGTHAWFNAPSGTAGNAITFTQAMTLFANGNLGLGTVLPTNYTGYRTLSINNTSGGVLELKVNDVSALNIFSDSAQSYLYEPRNVPIQFYTNTTEKVRIFANGNVLIQDGGTFSNNGARLQVNGTATFSDNISVNNLLTIAYADISTGNNRGLRIVNTDPTEGTAYNITAGRTGQNNGDFVIRNTTTGVNNLVFNRTSGAATFSSSVTTGGAVNLESNESYVNLFSSYAVGLNARARFRAVGAGGGSGYGGDFRLDTRATNNVWNTDVFVVNSSGNVGIGSTSPSGFTRTLKINTASGTAGILLADGETDRAGFYIDSGTTAPAYLFTNNSKPLVFISAGVEAMRIFSGQNVHIGPTPSSDNGARLQVSGTARITGSVIIDDLTNGRITFENQAGQNSLFSTTTGFSAYKTFNIYASGATPTLSLASTGAATFSSGIATNGYTASVSHAALFNGNVGIFTPSPRGRLAIRTQQSDTPSLLFQNDLGGPSSAISNYETAAQTYTAFGTNFYINSSASLTRFDTSKQSSAIIFDEGTLILATGPTSATASNRFSISPIGAATFSSSVTTGGNVLVPAGSGLAWSGGASRIMTPEDNVQGAKISTPGGFLAEASVFKFIGGNVGIGTPGPTFRLDVQNNTQAIARVLDTSTNASLIMQAGSGSAMKVTAYNYASSTALPLYIQVDGANTIMQAGGGNVLIGTTTDNGARLQVSGQLTTSSWINAANGFGLQARNAANTAFRTLIFLNSGNQIEIGRDTDISQIRLGTASAVDALTITSSGNLLVGTTTDNGARLQVSGAGFFSNTVSNLNNLIYSGGSLFLRNPANTFDWALYQDSANNLKVDFNGATRLTLTSGGAATFSSSVTAPEFILNNGSADGGQLVLASSGFSNWNIDNFSGSLRAYYGSTEVLRLNAIAQSKLYINGGSSTTFMQLTGNNRNMYIGQSLLGLDITQEAYADMVFATNATYRMRINADGNVWIGSLNTDTGDKLRVVGTTFTDIIKTSAPTGTSQENWRLGRALLATSSVPEDRWIRVQLGNRIYDILAIDRGLA